jgi:hypothetical protein
MTSQLALYKKLSVLHDEMADAAFALDWDKLIALERQSAELTLALQKSGIQAADADERLRTADLIRHIVEKQNRIREEIKVWKDDATPLLAVLNRSQPS